jgi:hypothetical protein
MTIPDAGRCKKKSGGIARPPAVSLMRCLEVDSVGLIATVAVLTIGHMDAASVAVRIICSRRLIARSLELLDRVAGQLTEAESRTLRSRPAGPDLYRLANRFAVLRIERALRGQLHRLHRATDALRLSVH